MINAVSDDDDDVASMVPEGPLSHRHPPSARHPPHPGSKDADEDDEEGAEGVECVDSGDGTIVADTARASRAAHARPPPSETAHTRAWEATAALATRLEELNLTRIGKQSEMAPSRTRRLARRLLRLGGADRRAALARLLAPAAD